MFTGTVDSCEVHPPIFAKRALELNAAAMVLFHNPPSGNPEPSAAVRAITAKLKQLLDLLNVRGFGPRRPGWDPRQSLAARGGSSRYNKARKTGLVLLAMRAMNSHVWSPLCSSCYTGNGADSEVVYNRQYGAHCLA
nr:JAB domain-containing protein [Xanthomonas euvesicatoria]